MNMAVSEIIRTFQTFSENFHSPTSGLFNKLIQNPERSHVFVCVYYHVQVDQYKIHANLKCLKQGLVSFILKCTISLQQNKQEQKEAETKS